MDALPEGYIARPATMDDVERFTESVNAFARSVIGADETNVERTRADWERPNFDPEEKILLVETSSGELVGAVEINDTSEVPVHPWVFGNVDPGHAGRGIGSYMMAWAEQKATQVFDRVPEDARVMVSVGTYAGHQPSVQLLTDRGFTIDRYFWKMTVELDAAPEAPRWPEGIELRPFDREEHAEAVFRAEDEAFQDHWGYIPESFESGYRRWSHSSFHESAYDPDLWFVAWDNDQIAGLARARPYADDDPEMGWIRTLSVRRPWRRRGLALALLLQSFGVFWNRGTTKVGLGVDGKNPTGATRLYEKAGMKVALQWDTFAKELRPGRELMNLGE